MERSGPGSDRAVRGLLWLLAAVLIGYAVSDDPFYGGEPGFGRLQMLIAAAGVGLGVSALLPVRIGTRVLLVAISSLVMLALAELVAGWLLAPSHRPIYQADNRLIFKFTPDRSAVMRRLPVNGGELVTHHINHDGFRGPELRPAGTAPRVVVYGDSFIHAPYIRDADSYPAVLGGLLSSVGMGTVEVVNAGVSSYGPDQVSLKMEDELPRLRPDLVIVAIFAGNDYGDLMRNKLFRLGADGTLVKNAWQLAPQVRSKFELSQRESVLLRALRSAAGAWRRSAGSEGADGAARFSDWDFLMAEADREYRSYVVEGDSRVVNTHVDYYSADVSLAPHSASARYKVALMQAVMGRIREVADRHGVPLAFLFIPHPNDVSDHYDWGQVDRRRFPDYDGRNQVAPLEEAARRLQVPFVSLYDAYRAADANALYFHGGDDHWNAAGQRLAAQRTAELVQPILAAHASSAFSSLSSAQPAAAPTTSATGR